MKKLLSALLILGSFASHGSNLEAAVFENDPESVRKAIVQALRAKEELTCTRDDSIRTIYRASEKKGLISFFESNSFIIKIDTELQQPVITAYPDHQSDKRNTFNITTSSDFLEIVKIDHNLSSLISAETNVGTIINPILVKEETREILFSEECI